MLTEVLPETLPDAQAVKGFFDSLTWQKVIPPLVLLLVGLVAVRLLLRLFDRALERSRLERAAYAMLRSVMKVLLYFILLLLVAAQLGVDVSSLVAILSVISLALSLAVQYYADPYIVANVPPNCFMPRPKVGSAVIRLTRHKEPPVDVKDERLMFRLIRASFNQRRKTLANGLNNSPELSFSKEVIQRAIEACGFRAGIRGETLTLADFAKLANVLTDTGCSMEGT